jgi:hypothetical protein
MGAPCGGMDGRSNRVSNPWRNQWCYGCLGRNLGVLEIALTLIAVVAVRLEIFLGVCLGLKTLATELESEPQSTSELGHSSTVSFAELQFYQLVPLRRRVR